VHSHESHSSGGDGNRSLFRKRLTFVLLLTAVFFIVEVVGGFMTGSLALLADAGHMLTDVASLLLALIAIWIATRPHSSKRSYGYQRAEVLAAMVNGMTLWLIVAFIFFEAATRFSDPPEVDALPMVIVATVGLVVNLIGVSILHSSSEKNLNMRGAFLHVVGDALGSLGAIVAGLFMLTFDWYLADPIVSIVIGLLILWSSGKLLLHTFHVLLEGTPRELVLEELESVIQGTNGVLEVHDIHAWTLTSGYNAMTAHVVVADDFPLSQREALLDLFRHMIPTSFPIHHLTIQMEESSNCCEEAHLPAGNTDNVHGNHG
jgi:cobalt-zinc-cadmium efflux system protein